MFLINCVLLLTELFEIELFICIKLDLALNNLQRLIYQTNKFLVMFLFNSCNTFLVVFFFLLVLNFLYNGNLSWWIPFLLLLSPVLLNWKDKHDDIFSIIIIVIISIFVFLICINMTNSSASAIFSAFSYSLLILSEISLLFKWIVNFFLYAFCYMLMYHQRIMI